MSPKATSRKVVFAALGAGVSLYEGIAHLLDPQPMQSPLVNYVVLGVSSMLLARETKALLMGEAARTHLRESILRIARSDQVRESRCHDPVRQTADCGVLAVANCASDRAAR